MENIIDSLVVSLHPETSQQGRHWAAGSVDYGEEQ